MSWYLNKVAQLLELSQPEVEVGGPVSQVFCSV